MGTPLPGRPVRGSSSGRPLMAAMDLLSRRWALRLCWELRDGPVGARALLARCEGLSSSVLYQRLADLTTAGLVTSGPPGYTLTDLGTSLGPALSALDDWAVTWAGSLRSDDEPEEHGPAPLIDPSQRLSPGKNRSRR
ncbi:helix-turn-helix domain-containing protein [Actinocorallia longicatena]|uniref:HTH hxlR-type domain-containing protein n=1 Tax=Actinocorallia longicatena TaxID=111803 RepID=A0ABP6QCE1_9ACTN